MQVQINSDRTLKVHNSESAQLLQIVEDALQRFEERITRVEMHLSDENATKGGPDDKRCMLEARLKGRKPQAVSHLASTFILAVEGAAEKLARSIQSDVGRRESAKRGATAPPLPDEADIPDE